MFMVDIRLKTNIFDNPKIKKLIWEFGDNGFVRLLKLWMFTAEHRPKGVLYDLDEDDIKMAMGFARGADSNADSMLSALTDLGLLEFDQNTKIYYVHEWKEHNGYAYYAKERSERASRAANIRWEGKQGQEVNAGSNANGMPDAMLNGGLSNAPSPSPSPSPNPKDKDDVIPYSDIIDDLNKRIGKNYKSNTQKTKDLIKARWNDGFRLADFKKVHRIKVADWVGSKFAKFLRPETLYGNKFDGYLNQDDVSEIINNRKRLTGDDLEKELMK